MKEKDSGLTRFIKKSLDTYFANVGDEHITGLHGMVIDTVERTLIADILERTGGNQSLAAKLLGINRNTLRAKMKLFKLS